MGFRVYGLLKASSIEGLGSVVQGLGLRRVAVYMTHVRLHPVLAFGVKSLVRDLSIEGVGSGFWGLGLRRVEVGEFRVQGLVRASSKGVRVRSLGLR